MLLDAEGAEAFGDGVGDVHRFFRLFRPLAKDADLDKGAALGPHVGRFVSTRPSLAPW